MDVNAMTFGIEIETTIPSTAGIRVGSRHAGCAVAGMPEGWNAQSDGSISAGAGRYGCEFVSPVLRGAEGLRSVIEAVAWIKGIGGQVNPSCGFHVHVGFDRTNTAALDRLLSLTANFEKGIFAATGTKNRERSNWCGSVAQAGDVQTAKRAGESQRYKVLNITNLCAYSNKPTVEFRAFGGTLNPEKIIGYIRLCLAMVQRAVEAKRSASWTGKQPAEGSPQRRKGDGATQLTRLFYQLGWTKGRMSQTYGAIVAEGTPSIRDSKRTLMALARKYDREDVGHGAHFGASHSEQVLSHVRQILGGRRRRRRRTMRDAILEGRHVADSDPVGPRTVRTIEDNGNGTSMSVHRPAPDTTN